MFLSRKSLGIEIHQNGYAVVLASGQASQPVIERYENITLSDDILRASVKEPNVITPGLLGAQIAETCRRVSVDARRVSLSIPDLAGRLMILDLEAEPADKEDGIDQLKWKLKKNFPFELADMHLDYQLLQVNDEGNVSLLVAIIAKSIINDYEEMLLAESLEPVTIDFATFNLYRVFASRLEVNDSFSFISCYRDVLSVLVFKDGNLDFFRSKAIGGAVADPARLYREVNSSLLVYADANGGIKPQQNFYYSSLLERSLLRSVILEAAGAEPILLDTDALIGSSRQQIDRATLPDIMSSLGAAARGLR